MPRSMLEKYENFLLDICAALKYNMVMKTKKKMGRPPIPAAERLGEPITVRVTKAERAALEAEAKRLGVSLSALMMLPWREPRKKRI